MSSEKVTMWLDDFRRHYLTDEELEELQGLEKVCGIQPFSEYEGVCLDPDAHAAARERCLALREKKRRWDRAMYAYASST